MGNLSLSAVDVVVAVVLLGSAGFAFMRGFVHEVLAIAAWVGAAFAALYGFPYAQPFFRQQIGTVWLADIGAGLTLFLVTLLALSLFTKAVANRVRNSALNSVDSSLGFVFGLIRGAVLLCLAYMVVIWFVQPEEPPKWLAEAKARPWLDRGSNLIRNLAPDGFGAEGPAKAMSEEARRAKEIERAYRTLAAPQPAAPGETGKDKDDKAQGYDTTQRREMDRLFQSTK